MKIVAMFLLVALAGCSMGKPDLPSAKGPWSCLNCDKWAANQNDITTAPPETGVVRR
jgi:hypothetical protein